MAEDTQIQVVAVGSVALDTIETPAEKREGVLGGSATYACAASSFFAQVGMVGVVGTDFPTDCTEVYRGFDIDLQGLQTKKGETFRWSGVYEVNMNERRTLSTDLNVFAEFRPALPDAYRAAPYVFLANISPELQLHVLSEVAEPDFVVADTMDLWIKTARDPLCEMIALVDMLMINDSEVRMLSGEDNLVRAARSVLEMGPQYVVVKKGEHGAMLFSAEAMFMVPAYPLAAFADPTGAGDTFAGGFIGALAESGGITESSVKTAMVYGSVVASFGVEAFGLERLSGLTRTQIDERFADLKRMMTL